MMNLVMGILVVVAIVVMSIIIALSGLYVAYLNTKMENTPLWVDELFETLYRINCR